MPLTRLILLLFVGQDVLFGPLVIFAFVNLLRPAHVLEAVLMMAGLFLAKTVVTTLMIISALRPYESFAAEERMERKGRLVAAADAALQRFPWQFALVYAVGWLFQSLHHLSEEGNLKIEQAVGLPATVYIPIPGNQSGTGKIQLKLQNRIVELRAVTFEEDRLATGTNVVVVEVINSNTVAVELARQPVKT